jgi:spore coat polysaccharide biosynthesis protein SpsF
VKTLIVVQARTGSTRLPGKVMLPLAGKPALLRMLERVLAARRVQEVVVATTRRAEDDALAQLVQRYGLRVFRGHATDLLDRHYRAAREARADAVAKIPSDCPLVDPGAIDRVLGVFEAEPGADYVGNLHPASWPDGNDVEVMSMTALERAWREARAPHEREHTTPFLWDQPERFRVVNVAWETGLDYSMTHRFTLDYPDDYAFLRAVYAALCRREQPVFGLEEVLGLLRERPELRRLNAHYLGVNWYRHHLDALRHVAVHETCQPPEERSVAEPGAAAEVHQ